MKIENISTTYLMYEYYLQSFTYHCCKDNHQYNLKKRELQKRKRDNNGKKSV